MAWFRVDDRLPDHRKARTLRKSHASKVRDAAPLGIWALAGAWSDDGFVPLEILEGWDDDAETLAERLVAAGMWHRSSRGGEPGYVFHDWHDQNPGKGDNDPSSSGTFGNHIRWHVQRAIVDPTCGHCPVEPSADDRGDDRGDIAPDSGGDSGGDDTRIGGESLPPDPTRPDPSRSLGDDESAKTRRRLPETPIPSDWQPTEAHRNYAAEHGLDLGAEAFKFRNHAIANDRRQRQWNATFATWLAKAVEYAPKQSPRAHRTDLPEAWQ